MLGYMNRPEIKAGTLEDRISHVLEELRVVLPGTQAFLGFQFVAVFSDGFSKLPQWQKDLHLSSLLFVTLSGLLLMTPAAYHRIVNEGGDTEGFHSFATRCLMLAMAALATGVSLDVLLVGRVILGGLLWAIVIAGIGVACFVTAWFILPSALRAERNKAQAHPQRSNVGQAAPRA
jgi:hypothetical protein